MSITHVAQLPTAQTCNCLLSTRPPPQHTACPSSYPSAPFYLACYELLQRSHNEDEGATSSDISANTTGEACYRGSVRRYEDGAMYMESTSLCAQQEKSYADVCTNDTLPGIFDLTWCSSSHSAEGQGTDTSEQMALLAACTDGSARLLQPSTLSVLEVYEGIHHEMLTSCSPVYHPPPSPSPHNAHPCVRKLLCTAHTGAVRLYDTITRKILREMQGHEYDAWCSAVLPSTMNDDGDDDNVELRPRLLSGGDDGKLFLHDLRVPHNTAVWRMQYEAGVVAITPVISTDTTNDKNSSDCTGSVCRGTPYVMVGCYDESLSLVDLRQSRRPVAERTRLGGGVWRTRNVLYYGVPCTREKSALHSKADTSSSSTFSLPCTTRSPDVTSTLGCIDEKNVLLLPLMQRGGALVEYDVRQSEAAVFGSPHYLPMDTRPTHKLTSSKNTAECLVYDMCVVSSSGGSRTSSSEGSALVATCSFYEKVIDLWRVDLNALSSV